MNWNLRAHILDHAHSVVNNLSHKFDKNNPKNQHFTLSIDVSQLILKKKCKTQKDIDNLMSDFMNDLVSYHHIFEESKGRSKTGNQLKRKILFDFKDALVAYHNSGSDTINSSNYTVEPHLHILFDKSKKLGIGYYQLKEAINKISKQHGLIFNFQEEVPPRNNSLQKSATNFTWFLKRSHDMVFAKKVRNKTKLVLEIEQFIQHYKNTGNIQFYIKGMKDFQKRLNTLGLDFELDGINLKDIFPLFLSPSQIETLEILHQGSEDQIYTLLSDRDNKLARAFFEHHSGFKNLVMQELIERGFSPLKFVIDIERINAIIVHKDESTKTKASYEKTLSFCYKSDLMQVLERAKNEKEVQLMMQSLGYKDFAYKQKTIGSKRSKVGFSFINKHNRSMTVYYASLQLSASDIRAKLLKNSKNTLQIANKTMHSFLDDYVPLNVKKSIQNTIFEKIYAFDTSFDLTYWYIKEINGQIVLQNKSTQISDEGNTIVVKRYTSNDLSSNARLLVDMAIAKGWDLEKILITGSQEFIASIEHELLLRKDNNNENNKESIQEMLAINNIGVRSSQNLQL